MPPAPDIERLLRVGELQAGATDVAEASAQLQGAAEQSAQAARSPRCGDTTAPGA